MSWTNLMKIRLIEIGLFAGASLGMSYYVGGVGLAFFFFSALFLWLVFTAYDVFPASSRYLASLVISALIPVFTVVVIVPQLGKNEWPRSIIFTPPSSAPTDYISINSNTLGTTNQWVLFVITGAILCFISILTALIDRRSEMSESHMSSDSSNGSFTTRILKNANPAISRYVVLIPLIGLSYLQQLDRTKSLAFMMSGDSRNIFRYVMRTRVTSSYRSSIDIFQNGGFGETLTSSISAMNGTKGFPRVADLTAMRSTYLIIFCLIVVSISILFTAKSEKWIPLVTPLRDTMVIAISVMVLFSPYPFAEILRSGFFSFFVGLGFLTATVVLLVPVRIQRPEVLLIACLAALVSFFSYQPAVLVVAPLLAVLSAEFFWQRCQSKVAHRLILLLVLATEIIAYLTYRPIYERLVLRVGTSGEIWPTDAKFTFFVFSVSGVLAIISRAEFRRTLLSVTLISFSGILSLRVIDFARGQDPDLYYLMKFKYATNFVSGILCIAIIAAVFNESAIWNRLNLTNSLLKKVIPVLRVVSLLGLVGGLFFAISNRTQASSPIQLIRIGWDAPSSSVAQKTFDLWKRNTPYIISGYFNEGNDRIANFWSPYFWEYNRWYWTYSGYSVSTEGLCNIISTNNVVIYTKSFGLENQMVQSCPEVSEHTKFFTREKHLFDFASQPD